jgi:predicted RNA-binding Zn ribbon-like protein
MPDTDVLTDPAELAAWGRRLGLLGERAPIPSGRELRRILELRTALHLSFSERDPEPDRPEIELIRAEYARAVAASELVPEAGAWRLGWREDDPRRIRFAIVADAVGLLQAPTDLRRVKRCPGRGCGWLFLDTSGRRRWCSMRTCGSRTKMRRHYARRMAMGA